jgi:hypothetical protein
MQKSIYYWLFFVCLLCLPMGSDAKIDSQNAPPAPLGNPVFAKDQRHFPTAHPLDRLRMPTKWRDFIEKKLQKRLYTEGSPDPQKKKKNPIWTKIFTIFMLVIAGALLVYWLQGTLGLLFATLGIASFWRNRDRINAWERRRQERIYAYKSEARDGRVGESLSHVSNKFTRRAITRFLSGMGLTFLGFILILATLFSSNVGAALGILITLMVIAGYIFTIVGVVNGIQAISANEPQSAWAWLVVIFGIPTILSLLAILVALASGF